jgi:hypothetical protein
MKVSSAGTQVAAFLRGRKYGTRNERRMNSAGTLRSNDGANRGLRITKQSAQTKTPPPKGTAFSIRDT